MDILKKSNSPVKCMWVFLFASGLWRHIWEVFYCHTMSFLQRDLLQRGCVRKSGRDYSVVKERSAAAVTDNRDQKATKREDPPESGILLSFSLQKITLVVGQCDPKRVWNHPESAATAQKIRHIAQNVSPHVRVWPPISSLSRLLSHSWLYLSKKKPSSLYQRDRMLVKRVHPPPQPPRWPSQPS